ncbi:MAG TPA: hypothetical protein VMZ91_12500 [Candidatus Paceibacterota bacterium]|nr:hypothetical protein [Candidatus Paceibacterota bacterium]
MTQDIKIDLFNLIDENETKPGSWIMAKGEKLNETLKPIIDSTTTKFGSKRKLTKYLKNKFNLSQPTSERFVFLMKEWHPLFLVREIADLANIPYFKIQENIDLLKINKPPLKIYKAVKELTEDLCKIIGAHAADGTLNRNFFRITDEYRSNIIAFQNWVKRVFGVEYLLKKVSEKEWCITFHSGIISAYLRKIFDFPSGTKQYTVSEPEVIKNAPLSLRKSFVLGALTFEAGVGMKHQVELCVSSKSFRDSIAEILSLSNIKFIKMKQQSGGYWRLWSNKLSKEEAKKWMELFEPKTEKWSKLRDYVYGFQGKVSSFEEAADKLDKIYSLKSSSKICLKDVLFIIKKLKKTYRYELVSYLCKNKNLESYGGKWAHSLSPYLNILKKANIIQAKKEKFGKKKSFGSIIREVYIYNPKTKEWRIPIRPIKD